MRRLSCSCSRARSRTRSASTSPPRRWSGSASRGTPAALPDLAAFDVVEATLARDPERDDTAQPEAVTIECAAAARRLAARLGRPPTAAPAAGATRWPAARLPRTFRPVLGAARRPAERRAHRPRARTAAAAPPRRRHDLGALRLGARRRVDGARGPPRAALARRGATRAAERQGARRRARLQAEVPARPRSASPSTGTATSFASGSCRRAERGAETGRCERSDYLAQPALREVLGHRPPEGDESLAAVRLDRAEQVRRPLGDRRLRDDVVQPADGVRVVASARRCRSSRPFSLPNRFASRRCPGALLAGGAVVDARDDVVEPEEGAVAVGE